MLLTIILITAASVAGLIVGFVIGYDVACEERGREWKPPVFNYDDYIALQKRYDALAMAARELVAENFALKEEMERAESRINSRDKYIQKIVGKWNW